MERTTVGSIASGGSACQLVSKHGSQAANTIESQPHFSRYERKGRNEPQPFG